MKLRDGFFSERSPAPRALTREAKPLRFLELEVGSAKPLTNALDKESPSRNPCESLLACG